MRWLVDESAGDVEARLIVYQISRLLQCRGLVDAGRGILIEMIRYDADMTGSAMIKVDLRYRSQKGNACGGHRRQASE